MNNLLFSLNATFPVFLVMLLGYILKSLHMLGPGFVKEANALNFKVALPALLFLDISTTNIREKWDTSFVLFCAITTTIMFFTIWGLSKLLIKDKSITGAFVQASFRSSAAILGVAFIQNMYGNAGMAPLMIIGTVPLFNIYSVIVLTFEANTEGEQKKLHKIKDSVVNIAKNPIILGILCGLLASLCDFHLYTLFTKTIKSISTLATPLALIALGAGFEGKKAIAKVKPTIIASLIKLVALPAIFLPFAYLLHFQGEKLVALLIMLASPTTVSCYIMADNMNNDEVITSSIVVLTTFLSAFTMTGWIYLLRCFHLI
ncbi:MAG: AEC family transporter [bacterium]|nr:AEC family transporter [bacterium]